MCCLSNHEASLILEGQVPFPGGPVRKQKRRSGIFIQIRIELENARPKDAESATPSWPNAGKVADRRSQADGPNSIRSDDAEYQEASRP